MTLADQPPAFAIIAIAVIVIAIAFGALLLFRIFEHLARRALERGYADLIIHPVPQPGNVVLSYHTYHGFIAWFTQTHHYVFLAPADARKLLGRLLRFNLTWGLVTPGALFIPPLAILNFFAQRRSIADQESAGGFSGLNSNGFKSAPVKVLLSTDFVISESPSAFHRFLGWVLAGLCVTFCISSVVCFATGEFDVAIAGVMVAMLFGWVARDWLGISKPGKN